MFELQQQLAEHLGREPRIGAGVYLGQGVVLAGDVTVGEHSSVWHNSVLRADINAITVGHHTNIQDGSVLHVADPYPCVVGNYVTVGHGVILHACTVGDETLIGMGATVLDGAVIGEQCLVGARALVTQQTRIPSGSLVLGSPAKVVRPLTPEERASLRASAEKYVRVTIHYLALRDRKHV
jgi:carbonic anhydrase/acetyltransferase-like protein (isoleucine patch superfamily)